MHAHSHFYRRVFVLHYWLVSKVEDVYDELAILYIGTVRAEPLAIEVVVEGKPKYFRKTCTA